MMKFELLPLVGALPLRFTMSRREVHQTLGSPELISPARNRSPIRDYWYRAQLNVSYSDADTVIHIGFGADIDVTFDGQAVLSGGGDLDPNPVLLRHDPAPLESLGFLIFPRLQFSTAGFHDDDVSQRALTLGPAGTWDAFLAKATPAELAKYRET